VKLYIYIIYIIAEFIVHVLQKRTMCITKVQNVWSYMKKIVNRY